MKPQRLEVKEQNDFMVETSTYSQVTDWLFILKVKAAQQSLSLLKHVDQYVNVAIQYTNTELW